MKNKKITRTITLGMYVLTTKEGGCIVDAVSQISSGDNPLIAVSVMKNNHTNELLKQHQKFALSVLDKEVNPDIIKTFGFNSSRDINKFENTKTHEVSGINVIKDSLGYMLCDVIDMIENDTHTLFIGRLIDGDVFKDGIPMSYNYYQEHKDELLKVETENGKTAWVCSICGYIFYGDEIPNDFECPICGVNKDFFDKK